MILTWEFILRDLIPLISAQFFVVCLVYFTMVRERVGAAYPYHAASLLALAVFLGAFVLKDLRLLHTGAGPGDSESAERKPACESVQQRPTLAPSGHSKERGVAAAGEAIPEIVRRTQAFIEQHFKEDIGAEDIARALRVSRSHLMAVFKKSTGLTLHQYLMNCRIDEACRLLHRHSVTEVAFEVGFNSSAYFSTAFKKRLWISPRVFQQRHRTP